MDYPHPPNPDLVLAVPPEMKDDALINCIWGGEWPEDNNHRHVPSITCNGDKCGIDVTGFVQSECVVLCAAGGQCRSLVK